MPILLFGGLLIILIGAELFTNAVEWLGRKLHLSHSVTGNLLAAVGTALPESIIPLIALYGNNRQLEVATGAVIGAPFMLSTLAFGICALSLLACRRKYAFIDKGKLSFELSYILSCFAVFFIACFGGSYLQRIIGCALIWAYIYYAWRIVKKSPRQSAEDNLRALYFSRRKSYLLIVLLQLAVGLNLVIFGARIFVEGITLGAAILGISPLILSLILAPIATELPEKFNSIIWILQGKDELAFGNITGAMVFQCTVIPAMIMLKTPLDLDLPAIFSSVCLVLSLASIYVSINLSQKVKAGSFLWGLFWYLMFLGLLFWSII